MTIREHLARAWQKYGQLAEAMDYDPHQQTRTRLDRLETQVAALATGEASQQSGLTDAPAAPQARRGSRDRT